MYLETGKRRSEIIKGKVEGDLLLIPVEEDLKTTKGGHAIKVNPQQANVIRELHRRRNNHLAKGCSIYTFKDNFTIKFSAICKKLKIKGTLHSLRHSQAIITYQETGDINAVKKKLNHSEIKTSIDYADINETIREKEFPQSTELGQEFDKLKKKLKRHKNEIQMRGFEGGYRGQT